MGFISVTARQTLLQLNNVWKKRIYKLRHSFLTFSSMHSITNEQENRNHTDYIWGTDSCVVDIVIKNFKVYGNFISECEEESLLREIEPIFKRRRYQFDHWDGAIQGYKETEKGEWNEENCKILQRLREFSFPENCEPMKLIHVLDLSKTGYIKPHIDSIKFCGNTIAGISLLSSSVMRLVMEKNKNLYADVLLQRRSLYIMSGVVRYEFTHEILKDSESFFKGIPIPRDHRISVICRNGPEDKNKV